MGEMMAAVIDHPLAEIRTSTEVRALSGSAGDFTVELGSGETVSAGAIVVATGFQHFDPGRETQQYGYYEFPDVITLADAEAMLKAHQFVTPSTGQPPKRVAFIQCVGSRDRQIGNEYCSKVCCGISSKQAIEVRQQVPDARVFIFYIDMRMYGYWENEIYWPAQEQHKVNYVKGIVTEVLRKDGRLLIRGEDTTMGRPMEVAMDVVVLAVGMEPSQGTRKMAEILGLRSNKYGFIERTHDSLDTVATSVPGIFVCGSAAGPADLDDTISTAGAAAAKAVALLRRSEVPA
jgi:heterodisulfide reductase subunit A